MGQVAKAAAVDVRDGEAAVLGIEVVVYDVQGRRRRPVFTTAEVGLW